MSGKRKKIPQPPESESPNWYAAKETAKEMWNAQDYVPAKQKLLKKLRDAGLPDLGSDVLDAALPNNPTQAVADLAGIGLVGKAGKALRAIRAADQASRMQDRAMQQELDRNRQMSREEAWEGMPEEEDLPEMPEGNWAERLEKSERYWDSAIRGKPRK